MKLNVYVVVLMFDVALFEITLATALNEDF